MAKPILTDAKWEIGKYNIFTLREDGLFDGFIGSIPGSVGSFPSTEKAITVRRMAPPGSPSKRKHI